VKSVVIDTLKARIYLVNNSPLKSKVSLPVWKAIPILSGALVIVNVTKTSSAGKGQSSSNKR
jgi:hypothetical protein